MAMKAAVRHKYASMHPLHDAEAPAEKSGSVSIAAGCNNEPCLQRADMCRLLLCIASGDVQACVCVTCVAICHVMLLLSEYVSVRVEEA